jgi:hypothetical protein
VHNDPASVRAKQDLGFVIDTEFAPKTGLHGDVNQAVVGDVIHMIAPKFVRDSVIEDQAKRREMVHGKPKSGERETPVDSKQFGDSPLPTINESKTANVDAERIAQALKPTG